MSISSAHSASLTSVNILLYVLSDDNSIMELTGRTLQTVGVGFKHIQSPNVFKFIKLSHLLWWRDSRFET